MEQVGETEQKRTVVEVGRVMARDEERTMM